MAEITTTERLPFPLAMPNADTFVTQTSEIGHNGQPLDDVLEGLNKEVGKSAKNQDCEENVSLGISDSLGYLLVEFKDGHIKTKKFDSRNIQSISVSGTKLIIS